MCSVAAEGTSINAVRVRLDVGGRSDGRSSVVVVSIEAEFEEPDSLRKR